MKFDGRVKIAGVGETAVGRVAGVSVMELHVQAAMNAIVDARIDRAEIDAVFTGNSRAEPFLYYSESLAEYMGLAPRHCETVSTGGATTLVLLQQAAAGIAEGRYETALVVMAESLHSRMGRDRAVESFAGLAHPEYETPHGPTIPALYALLAQRYLYENDLPADALAVVPVFERHHAVLGHEAQFREALTIEQVVASRLIADPLRLLECAPVSDSGGAVILRRADAAGTAAGDVLFVAGGEAYGQEHVSQIAELGSCGVATRSAQIAFADAGIGLDDIDVSLIYDAFSVVFCLLVEALGFCGRGEAPAYVQSGATSLTGATPCNPHGGLLSHGHSGRPSSLLMFIEAVKQLRGGRGAQQVEGARTALVHAEGGMVSTHGTAILRVREAVA